MLVQMDARSIVSAAFRQLRRFLFIFIFINLLAVAYLLTATRVYESAASLLVKFGQDARPEVTIEGMSTSGLSAEEKRGLVQSNLNILTSRDLAQAVLAEVGIDKAYPAIAAQLPEGDMRTNAAVKAFMTSLEAATISDAGIINVTLANTNPAMTTELLTKLLDLFQQKQATIFGNPQTGVLSQQANDAAKRLEEANRKLSNFKVENGITALDEELSMLLKQRGDLTGYLSRRQDSMPLDPVLVPAPDQSAVPGTTSPEAANTTLSALPARIGVSGDSSRFPVLEDIQKRIDGLRAKEAELLLTYRGNSKQVQAVRRNIEAEEAALRNTLTALSAQVNDLDQQIAAKQKHRIAYDDLVRQSQIEAEAYRVAQERYQSALVNDDLTQRKITRISVIQQPTIPEKPSNPKKTLTLLLSIIVGGALAAAACLLSELLDQSFSSTEQLRAVLKQPVLASFMRRRRNQQASRQDLAVLHQSIEAGLPANGARIVQLASCYSGEGASTVAQDLAAYASQMLKRRVLVIEQDRAALNGKIPSTLLDVAEGTAQLANALIAVGPVHFAVLSDREKVDIALAHADKVKQLLTQQLPNYDLILISTAGIMQNSAAMGLSMLADGVVIVVEAEKTRAPVVKQVVTQLSEAGARVLGTVLNKRKFYIPRWLYAYI